MQRKYFTFSFSLLLFLLLAGPSLLAQETPQIAPQSPRFDNPKHEYQDELPTVSIVKKKRQKTTRFRGYGKQKKLFKALCAAIAEDGRNEWLYENTKDFVRTTIGCVACKQFFKALSSSCRPKAIRRPKIKKRSNAKNSNEETETNNEKKDEEYKPPRKRMEPNIIALDLTSRLFREIAINKQLSLETYEAIKILLPVLREKKGKTPGEQSYFEILAEFIFAPYREYQKMLDFEARLAEAEARENNSDRFDLDVIFGEP